MAPTLLEKPNLIKTGEDRDDNAVVEVVELESGDDSESDNEEIIHPEVIKKGDVNINDEFEKIVPLKFERLSGESSDEIDNEIAEILNEAEPLGKELQISPEVVQPKERSDEIITKEVEIKTEVLLQTEAIRKEPEAESISVQSESEPQETFEEEIIREEEISEQEKTAAADEQQKVSDIIVTKPIGEEAKKASINDATPNETIIEEKLVPKETPLTVEETSSEEKPPVPIQTYLWEDVRRAKEQVSGDNVCTSICYVPSNKYLLRSPSA